MTNKKTLFPTTHEKSLTHEEMLEIAEQREKENEETNDKPSD